MAFQLGGTLLDACVLAVLKRQDVYGYRLTQEVRTAVELSGSTLYPVLRRLQKDGCLATYDEPFHGRNRKYYKITNEGEVKLEDYLQEWSEHKIKINRVLEGGKENG